MFAREYVLRGGQWDKLPSLFKVTLRGINGSLYECDARVESGIVMAAITFADDAKVGSYFVKYRDVVVQNGTLGRWNFKKGDTYTFEVQLYDRSVALV